MTPNWVHRPGAGPRIVHVSASSAAGGVAELLRGLVPAQARAGESVGWAVIAGNERFFTFNRYLYRLLCDRATPDTEATLSEAVPRYRALLEPQGRWLAEQLTEDDVVVLHDPHTLGLAPALARDGIRVVWHCHTGTTDECVSGPDAVWRALRLELAAVDTVVSTLPEFAPRSVPAAHRFVAAPAIDPDSPKNRPLGPVRVRELLAGIGLTEGGVAGPMVEQDAPLPANARVLLQVARWDPVKDMPGVLRCLPRLPADVHAVLVGPDPAGTPHEPRAAAVLDEVRAVRAQLSERDRARVHLVLPGTHDEHSALVVNAVQRRADVVLQKSLAEGFGLSTTEAMAKGRAVVAADVGGLRQQISPGHTGLLVDPRHLDSVVDALGILFQDPLLRRRLGRNAAESARRRYLMPRLVADYRTFAAPGRPARAHVAA